MLPWIDVDSSKSWVLWVSAAPIFVACLLINRIHMLKTFLFLWLFSLASKLPSIHSFHMLQVSSILLSVLALQSKMFFLKHSFFLRYRERSLLTGGWFMSGWKINHFVKIGWPFFPWGQQHCHKDGNDKKSKDCSNHSPCYSNRRCLLKWHI